MRPGRPGRATQHHRHFPSFLEGFSLRPSDALRVSGCGNLQQFFGTFFEVGELSSSLRGALEISLLFRRDFHRGPPTFFIGDELAQISLQLCRDFH